jgi:hypothetical protein
MIVAKLETNNKFYGDESFFLHLSKMCLPDALPEVISPQLYYN